MTKNITKLPILIHCKLMIFNPSWYYNISVFLYSSLLLFFAVLKLYQSPQTSTFSGTLSLIVGNPLSISYLGKSSDNSLLAITKPLFFVIFYSRRRFPFLIQDQILHLSSIQLKLEYISLYLIIHASLHFVLHH